MKLGPVTKYGKRKMMSSKKKKKKTITLILMSSSFSQFIDDLEQFRQRISGAWSVILKVIIVPFYLTKSENRTKGSLTQFSYYYFECSYFFVKKC